MAIRLRDLTAEEHSAISQLAHSRTAPARLVERARMVWHAAQGERVPAIAERLGVDARTVRLWLGRFQTEGLEGLEDRPRPGAPVTYTPEVVGEVIATALTDPKTLEMPFGCWSIRRLQAYLNEEKGIPIRRSRLDDLLIAEGLRWRSQETWFGERATLAAGPAPAEGETPPPVDPEFAQKRGSSAGFTRPRRSAA
jgi:transposase